MNCVLLSKIYFSLLLEGKSMDIWISEKSRGKDAFSQPTFPDERIYSCFDTSQALSTVYVPGCVAHRAFMSL